MNSIGQIHISEEPGILPWADLAPILQGLLPVEFVFGAAADARMVGRILTGTGAQVVEAGRGLGISSLTVPPSASTAAGEEREVTVRFADSSEVPFPFGGRSLRTKTRGQWAALSLQPGETLLASSETGPLWAGSESGGVKHFRSAMPLPAIPAGGNLYDVLNGERFLELLPLLHWLREVLPGVRYDDPPLRACFILDDPNLHWPNYGFADYRQIAAHATKENYHVAFATIPLDAWFAHRGAAETFRTNGDRLSLVVHGNNHTRKELAQEYTAQARGALVRQAVHRVAGLEARTGVPVWRMMVPPHGACSEEMLSELPRSGFEGACISHSSLRAYSRGKPWTKGLGYLPAELVAGCPVLPRWGFRLCNENYVLLAAFLRQALIFSGHHQDLKNGIEVLDHLARLLNGLGDVSWCNPAQLCRTNFASRRVGETLHVRARASKLALSLPEGVTGLVLEPPAAAVWDGWQIVLPNGQTVPARVGERVTIPQGLNGTLGIEASSTTPVPPVNGVNRPAPLAFCRRLATEGRDRLLSLKCLTSGRAEPARQRGLPVEPLAHREKFLVDQ